MTNKKIILAGGTGFLGQEMIKYFGGNNQIVVLTRQVTHAKNNRNHYNGLTAVDLQYVRYVKWDGETTGEWATELESADLVINLAGQSVNCRYNEYNKQLIFDSRTNSVKAIGRAISQCSNPPKCWINASSATIYRHAEDRPNDEYNGEYHNDFSVQVCKRWETVFFEQNSPGTRKIALRMAITLGPGGVLIPYFNLLKFGLGGPQGSGKQMFSWIHVEDSCRMIEWIFEHDELEGVYNCCSPNPVSNREFMRLLREATGHRFGLPAFTWMLKLGAPLIGTETELVLKSRWVIPTRITETGFEFRYPFLKNAFDAIIRKVPRKQYHLF